MPSLTRDLVELAGVDVAMRLSLALGGQNVHFPMARNLRPDHPLVRAVGPRAARIVARELGGETHYVPAIAKFLAPWLAEQGRTDREIAALLGIRPKTARVYMRSTWSVEDAVAAGLPGD